MRRLTMLAAVALAIGSAGAGPATNPTRAEVEALRAEVEQLRTENRMLREVAIGVRPRVQPATVPASRPAGAVAVGMTMADVEVMAKRDGLRLEKVDGLTNPDGTKQEIWRLSRIEIVATGDPRKTVERRADNGWARAHTAERMVWGKIVRLREGVVFQVQDMAD